MAAELMEMRRPVGVCTWVGRRVDELAKMIVDEIRAEVEEVGAWPDFHFEPCVESADALAAMISRGRHGILQIVSHADDDGMMKVSDVWGSLDMTPENLTLMLRGASVRVVVVMACFGAQIAQALVASGAVEVAIGMEIPLTFAGARAFSRGFYRALAQGRSIDRAFADGQRQAAGRDGAKVDRLRLFGEAAATGKAVFAPPDFYLVGTPSKARADATDRLRAALAPFRVFHMDDAQMGDDRDATLASRLEMAQVVAVFFENDRLRDFNALAAVAAAVEEMQHRPLRVFPLYLSGTTPHRNVPFGLRRLVPAFLEDPRYGGDYEKLGAAMKALLA